MRPIVIGLFVAVLAAILTPAAGAFAATPVASGKALPPPPIDPDMRKKGKAAAPDLVKTANINCQIVDARELGESTDAKTKVKSTYYEVACKDSGGFIIASHAAPAPPDVATCIEVAGTPAACALPADLDPKAPFVAVASRVDPNCVVANARGIGHAADGSKTVFELACADGSGFMLETSYPFDPAKPVKLLPCIVLDSSASNKCTLTTAEAHMAAVDSLIAQAVKDCVVKDRRYMGSDTAGVSYYEFACQNGKGYILPQNVDLSLGKPIDCENTDQCTLTDIRARKSEQAGLYSKLAQAGGYNCDVAEYAPFNVDLPKHEVIELSCTNRPDGAVAIFAASSSEPAVFYDCAHSEMEGYRCGITKPDAAVASLTADLKTLKRDTCTVSASHYIGVSADKHGYVEVACADGLPGYTIEYTLTPLAPDQAFPCTGPPPVNGTCTLPGNAKK